MRKKDIVQEIELELNKDNDIYTKDGVVRMTEDDDIDLFESGFMLGYLAS